VDVVDSFGEQDVELRSDHLDVILGVVIRPVVVVVVVVVLVLLWLGALGGFQCLLDPVGHAGRVLGQPTGRFRLRLLDRLRLRLDGLF
jgi:hypothetical protein